MNYLLADEVAIKWRISSRRVRKLCSEGRVSGVIKKGKLWLIPDIAEKPKELSRGRKREKDVTQ